MIPRDNRFIGGVYRVGQVMTTGPIITICTAYDRNSNDVVGLFVVELPTQLPPAMLQQWLRPFEQRRVLHSPHIMRIHRIGTEGNRLYIATDPPRGVTLQHVLDHENVDLQRAVNLVRQVAQGLDALHTHGIAGLDLRPQLITVDTIGLEDRVQIDDIGLRTFIQGLGGLSEASQKATDIAYVDPRYTPPEYSNNGAIGPWSDIYQLGLLLFTIITGRLPFVGRTAAETGVLHTTSPVPRITRFAKDTPDLVQDIVDCAMDKDPERRFTTAKAFINALNSLPKSTTLRTSGKIVDTAKSYALNQGLTREISSIQNPRLQGIPLKDSQTVGATPLPSMPPAYAYLCYEKEEATTQRIPITQQCVIVGRQDPKRGVTPDVDLSRIDPKMTISRQHARIRYEETFFTIEDLKSRNKTRLREAALEPFKIALLKDGDIFSLGSVLLRFEVAKKGLEAQTEEQARDEK